MIRCTRALRGAGARPIVRAGLAVLTMVWLAAAPTAARAQEDLSDVFDGFGTTTTVEEGSGAPDPTKGRVEGQVLDAESGLPVRGATVILIWPPPADGSEAHQEVAVTDVQGYYAFEGVPPGGGYKVSFVKSGYRTSAMTGFEVRAGQMSRGDFPLPPLASGTAQGVLDLDAFVVEASTVDDLMASLELRLDSDELLNVMSAEDLSRYAAGDVAEALKRVAGVNIVEGQFAIIRGLEDRYSSTLYNSAPVPSPDPDRQSVQLDLFPSDVVSNLVVAKSFAPDMPGNSAGGSIDVVTSEYPAEYQAKFYGGLGGSGNAWDRFLEYEGGNPYGKQIDGWDTLESDWGGSFGGRDEWWNREFRFKLAFNKEIDYVTAEGWQESREPRQSRRTIFPPPGRVLESGGLALGELGLSRGRFDYTQSEREDQRTAYGGFGFDIDEDGDHRIDGSIFYTRKRDEIVELRDNGQLPNFDYGRLTPSFVRGGFRDGDFIGFATASAWITTSTREEPQEFASRGHLWFTNLQETRSFERDRELRVYQLNGDHDLDALLDGLHFDWAWNRAESKQDEQLRGMQFFFEPCGFTSQASLACPEDVQRIPLPNRPLLLSELGPGFFGVNERILASETHIEETQNFVRADGDYAIDPFDWLGVELRAGTWYEHARRDADSEFLETASLNGATQFFIQGDTPADLGRNVFSENGLDRGAEGELLTRDTSNESTREILAWHAGLKASFWDDVDVLGGVRIEKIQIESKNDPFTETVRFGAQDTFPSRYLFFDRLDNPDREGVPPPTGAAATFNDQILGIDVSPYTDPSTGYVDLDADEVRVLVNGEIDETKFLPSAGVAYRPLEGLVLRGAYSQTVARPSFREMGYYVTVETGSDDFVVGNPQLELSDVESFDGRIEYVWGEVGDLVAFSAFYKRIDDPIESIILRDPTNAEESSKALFRTFFNNPNQAKLWGVEAEARKALDFLGIPVLEYLSIGGNFTWIQARVDRTEVERIRAQPFFDGAPGDDVSYTSLGSSRRLFAQPKWIANADITFDQPDWGTRVTLAWFGISDVLDAAGTAQVFQTGAVEAITLDRYIDSYGQLDLIGSQTWHVDLLRGDLTLKASVKNLTDSRRRIVYDGDQTSSTIVERSYHVGRDYSFGIQYTIVFD